MVMHGDAGDYHADLKSRLVMTIILIDCHADLKSRLAMTFEGALRARGFIFFCLYVKNTSNLSRIVLFLKY